MTEITETICRPKQSWLTAPGISKDPETTQNREAKVQLQKAIEDLFEIPAGSLIEKNRHLTVIFGKHLFRYILERLLKNGTLAGDNDKRIGGLCSAFKYSLYDIEKICNCNHATVLHSCKSVRDLSYTNKDYRAKVSAMIYKVECGLIIFPEIIKKERVKKVLPKRDNRSLSSNIQKVFKLTKHQLKDKDRGEVNIYAKCLYRYILERALKDNTIAGPELKRPNNLFKYLLPEIGKIIGRDSTIITGSCNKFRDIYNTNGILRAKAQIIFEKISNNQIIMP